MVLRLLAICLAMMTGAAAGANTLKAGPWTSDCEQPFCVFQKTLQVVDTNAVFAVVEILINVEDGSASIVTTAPLGVAIEPGILLLAAGQERRMTWKVCHPDGCRATADLDSAAFAALLQQPTITIRYIPFGADAPVEAALRMDSLITAISEARP